MRFWIFTLLSLISLDLFADCRGCCSGHGGVVCSHQVTQCQDGSALSAKCEAKGCTRCSGEESFKQEIPTSINTSYKRSLFSGWTDEDHNCLDTRAEILKARSKTEASIEKSKSGNCKVVSGVWEDYYYDETLTLASKIDIDHIVPLKHAFDTGAKTWTQEKRDHFATDPENLVITNLSYNRMKGAKTILEWMPMNRAYACRYVKQWFYLKDKYDLKISEKEIEFKNQLKCETVKHLPAN